MDLKLNPLWTFVGEPRCGLRATQITACSVRVSPCILRPSGGLRPSTPGTAPQYLPQYEALAALHSLRLYPLRYSLLVSMLIHEQCSKNQCRWQKKKKGIYFKMFCTRDKKKKKPYNYIFPTNFVAVPSYLVILLLSSCRGGCTLGSFLFSWTQKVTGASSVFAS